jgi:nucleolar protein 4
LPNSPAAAMLAQVELEKRAQSYEARRRLLKTNPALFVSRTRLSVRQLPLFVTDRTLKRMAIYAVRQFEGEVVAGARKALSPDELAEPVMEEGLEGPSVPEGKVKKFSKKGKKERHTSVKQAKVVCQQDRIDAVTGKGRSKGYGFLEMHTHADALRVLRWANNNAELGALLAEWWKEELEELVKAEKGKKGEARDDARIKRMEEELERVREEKGEKKKGGRGTLIVEFSIENVQVVQRRATRQKEAVSLEAPGPHERTRTDVHVAQKTGEHAKVKSRDKTVKDKKVIKDGGHADRKLERKRKRSVAQKDEDAKSDTEANPASEAKPGQNIGSIIGRKRKKRKMGN